MKRGRGRPTVPIVTPIKVASLLTTFQGNISAVARELGVTRRAVERVVHNNPELQDVRADADETLLDNALSGLHVAVSRIEPWAICTVLRYLGGRRGYVDPRIAAMAAGAAAATSANTAGFAIQTLLEMLPYDLLTRLLPFIEGATQLTGANPVRLEVGNGTPIPNELVEVREDILEDAKPES